MPRDGLGQYSPPPGTNGITNFTIESTKYNAYVADVTADLNAARPIVAGGTAATTADGALDNLSAEKYKQVVTDWSSNVWRAGSFYAATSATGAAPVAAHAFAGIVYYANATDFVIEATDLTAGGSNIYKRIQTAGVWGSWISSTSGTAKKNYIINGAMMVTQENPALSSQPAASAGYYPVDMFFYNGYGTSAVVSVAQVVQSSAGSPFRIRVTTTTSTAAPAAGHAMHISTAIEGYRAADLYVSGPRTITLQFWVKAPQGTYCVSFRNSVPNRSYIAEYVISAAEDNQDVMKSVTLVTDQPPTPWDHENGVGIAISWSLICGTNYQTAPGIWTNGNYTASPNQSNLMFLNGNTFDLWGVSLTEGAVAPPFVVPDYARELALCQRYYYKRVGGLNGYTPSGGFLIGWEYYPVFMRSTATMAVITAPPAGITGGMTFDSHTVASVRMFCNATAPGMANWDGFTLTAAARL